MIIIINCLISLMCNCKTEFSPFQMATGFNEELLLLLIKNNKLKLDLSLYSGVSDWELFLLKLPRDVKVLNSFLLEKKRWGRKGKNWGFKREFCFSSEN